MRCRGTLVEVFFLGAGLRRADRRRVALEPLAGGEKTGERVFELLDRGCTTRGRHNIYVVELDRAVLGVARFRRANPSMKETYTCLYVGMTGLDPQERFRNHKRGYKSSWFAREFGLRLLPVMYECFNPLAYDVAAALEVEYANMLRGRGYGVWQG
jgi:hypothetical protein